MRKPPKKTQSVIILQQKYRVRKRVMDGKAMLGFDLTPQVFRDGDWVNLGPATHDMDACIWRLKLEKANDEVTEEYIYPDL